MGAKVGCGPNGTPQHEQRAPPRQQENRFLKLAEAGAPFVHLILPTSFEIYAQSIELIHKLYFESCPQSDLNFLKLSRNSFNPFFTFLGLGLGAGGWGWGYSLANMLSNRYRLCPSG